VHDVLTTQCAGLELLCRDGNHRLRYDIAWKYIQITEEVPVIFRVGFEDVIHQDILLLRILLEVLFKTFVGDDLLFEFQKLLLQNAFVAQHVDHLLHPRLGAGELLPHQWEALEHVLPAVFLCKLALEELESFKCISFYHGQNPTSLLSDELAIFLVQIEAGRHVKIDHIDNILDRRSLGVAGMHEDDDIKLANVEKMDH
jgi:hypothetical protein